MRTKSDIYVFIYSRLFKHTLQVLQRININWASHLIRLALLGMSLVSRCHTWWGIDNRYMRKLIPEKENKPIGDDIVFIMITY